VYTNPQEYIANTWIRYGLILPYLTDKRASLLPLDETLKNAYDPYTFVRDAYLQRRAYLISDGKVTESPLEDPDAGLPPDDDPADAQKTPPQPEKH